MKKILISGIIFCVGFASALILTHGSLSAQGAINESDIMSKLDEISKNQEETIAAVNSMKEDIQIIKIRITQMQ